jgi:hypothetical protein
MKAGLQIACVNGHEICKIGPKGLRVGTKLRASYLTDWRVKPFKDGEPTNCPVCNASVFESHSLFGLRVMTPDGWRYADRYLDKARQHEIRTGIEGIR